MFEKKVVRKTFSIVIGFVVLFFIYHFPEFFQPFWITVVFKVGFLFVAVIVAKLQGWKWLEGYGISFSYNKWYIILLTGLLIGSGAFIISIIESIIFNTQKIQSIESLYFFLMHLPLTLLMTFFPSIAEDILTRGYLYAYLKNVKPLLWAFISAVIYVLNHIWRLNDDVSVLVYLFLLGLVLGISVCIKKSLWLAFGIHWGANIVYELSNMGLKQITINNHNLSNWLLAMVWAIIFILLLINYRKQLNINRG
ncbi:MAG: CPBP family intramembrane metalloprotease [Bacteroidetes bacterium]|nr:CPBP family intramembrane metalloprotease [Bacteroidota bacterium]MBS1650172.1 CPBP family intramembrane metalloprotease [Bacteroidota bacterium]